jgi:hypothetical protein
MNNTTQLLPDAGELVGGFTTAIIGGIAFAVFVAAVFMPLFVWGIYSSVKRIEKAQKHIFERQEKLLIDIRTALQRQAK